jgi:hypothetical protein
MTDERRFRMRRPTYAQQIGWVLFLTALLALALFRWLETA